MSKINNPYFIIRSALFTCLMMATGHLAKATGNLSDTLGRIPLSIMDKEISVLGNDKHYNVIYPDILSGNEEQTLAYIEKFSAKKREYLIRTYNKGKKFFPKAEAILHKQQVAGEFKVLIALESAFNANVVSRAGAVGYWQFMDESAKEYGLKIPSLSDKKTVLSKRGKKKKKSSGKKQDDRTNFVKSTNAAARYLKDRSRNFNNDCLLMVASYNCGTGNVREAMQNCGKKNPTFWDIKKRLPAETRAYVMNFIALNVIFNNYNKFVSNKLCFTPDKTAVEDADEDNAISTIDSTPDCTK